VSYFSGGELQFYDRSAQTVVLQESPERAETLRTMQKMAEEIRALKANVQAMHVAQNLSAKAANGRQGLKARLAALQTETDAAIAELAGKVERLHCGGRRCRLSCRLLGIRSGAGPKAGAQRARRCVRGFCDGSHRLGSSPPAGKSCTGHGRQPDGENAYGQRTN
jgi:hypothetical protein